MHRHYLAIRNVACQCQVRERQECPSARTRRQIEMETQPSDGRKRTATVSAPGLCRTTRLHCQDFVECSRLGYFESHSPRVHWQKRLFGDRQPAEQGLSSCNCSTATTTRSIICVVHADHPDKHCNGKTRWTVGSSPGKELFGMGSSARAQVHGDLARNVHWQCRAVGAQCSTAEPQTARTTSLSRATCCIT